jgi:hypothetical protein
MPGATLSATAFITRAWREGELVRVVVSVARQGEQETQIHSAVMRLGTVLKIAETERYGAAPIGLIVGGPR